MLAKNWKSLSLLILGVLVLGCTSLGSTTREKKPSQAEIALKDRSYLAKDSVELPSDATIDISATFPGTVGREFYSLVEARELFGNSFTPPDLAKLKVLTVSSISADVHYVALKDGLRTQSKTKGKYIVSAKIDAFLEVKDQSGRNYRIPIDQRLQDQFIAKSATSLDVLQVFSPFLVSDRARTMSLQSQVGLANVYSSKLSWVTLELTNETGKDVQLELSQPKLIVVVEKKALEFVVDEESPSVVPPATTVTVKLFAIDSSVSAAVLGKYLLDYQSGPNSRSGDSLSGMLYAGGQTLPLKFMPGTQSAYSFGIPYPEIASPRGGIPDENTVLNTIYASIWPDRGDDADLLRLSN